MQDLRYPIGKYQPEENITQAFIDNCIAQIESLPANMRAAVEGLSEEQLDTPYRPDGWTVRQVLHHVGDSHMNAVVRFKWTLTEPEPTIKAYNEKDWALTADVNATPVAVNIGFLEVLHHKWTRLLRSIKLEEFDRAFVHPETNRRHTLGWLIGLYAWHSQHHVAHITSLREREGW